MTRAACTALLLVVLCLLPVSALAEGEDPTLVDIYNTLFQTNLTSAQLNNYLVTDDEIWDSMAGQVRGAAMFAESNSFTFGTYADLGGGNWTTDLFSVTNRGYLNGQPRANLIRTSSFGFFAVPGAYPTKFSEAILNPGGYDNLRTYESPFPNIYLLAWEETDNLADGDFNDFVATLRIDTAPVAVPATVGSGPFPANPNHKVQVTLDATGSWDADGDPLTYRWAWPGGAAAGPMPTVTLSEGDTTITLVVNDAIVDSAPATMVVSVSAYPNVAPVADAGQDQTVDPFPLHYAQVSLNGSGSSDFNEDPLTYEWTWSTDQASGVSPTITLDEGQTYVISLRVYDGHVWSSPDTCSVTVGTTTNVAPVVTAPPDIAVHAAPDGVAHVELMAAGSDPNLDPLTYYWSWSGGSAEGQTIIADLPEDPAPPVEPVTHIVSVQAWDGMAYSPSDTCQVTVLPARPVADAGPDPAPVSAELNHTQIVTLDGTASYSRYGYPVTYKWSWSPNGHATGPTPTITLPEGQTTVILVVNDGSYDSEPDTVMVEVLPAPNLPPEADAGSDQTLSPALNHRATVQLDGSGSWDPNSDLLIYTWTWTDLGTLEPMEATGVMPQVDLYEGVNTITLTVFDGELAASDDVVITLTPVPNIAPVANAGVDQTIWPRLDRTGVARLDGSGSYDDNEDPLTYTWTWTDIVTGLPKVESGRRPTVILPIGVTVIQLVVNDGQVSSTNQSYVTITVTPLHARVPSDFVTIQEAIDFCQDGDMVVAERGTHYGAINFHGKAITVMGQPGWEDCIIRVQGGGTAVTFASGEGPGSRLYNLTIRGGFNVSGGAGIRIENASPTIVSCRLTQNSQGGAVYITGSAAAPRLANLLIHNNIASNYATAVWVVDHAKPVITNCTIYGNVGGGGAFSGAILLDGECQAEFRDCIIYNNTPRNRVDYFTASTFTYCDIGPYQTIPGTGNIAADPRFVAGSLSEYYLKQVAAGQDVDSPCVDAGSSTAEEWVAEMAAYGEDIAADLAQANTRSDGQADTGVLDIGFHHHPKPIHILEIWVTKSTGGLPIGTLFISDKVFFWVKYQVEGNPTVKYKVKRKAEITGPFSLTRGAKARHRTGIYIKKIGNENKPIVVPYFPAPPGQTQVDANFKMTVKVKQVKTTLWLGEDSLSIVMKIKCY